MQRRAVSGESGRSGLVRTLGAPPVCNMLTMGGWVSADAFAGSSGESIDLAMSTLSRQEYIDILHNRQGRH
jgi:hypothetical protein